MSVPMPETGFRVFSLDHPESIRTMRKKLQAIRTNKLEDLIGCASWDIYNVNVGFIQGIEEALRVCNEMDRDGLSQ